MSDFSSPLSPRPLAVGDGSGLGAGRRAGQCWGVGSQQPPSPGEVGCRVSGDQHGMAWLWAPQVTNLFLSFVRTMHLPASTQRLRTRPKAPATLTSWRLSSRKVGGRLSGLGWVDSGLCSVCQPGGPRTSPSCISGSQSSGRSFKGSQPPPPAGWQDPGSLQGTLGHHPPVQRHQVQSESAPVPATTCWLFYPLGKSLNIQSWPQGPH